jgi:hypothetical protein
VPAATPLPRGPSVLTLYSAADLLTAPGCPVCRYAAEASDRYLGWFALEGHADPAMITALCASLGTCAAHTRRLASQPGAATRLTAVYRYVVIAARDLLMSRGVTVAPCPACQRDTAAGCSALDTLLDGLSDPQARSRCRELGGVCVPHLSAARAAGPRSVAAWLADTLHEILAASPSAPGWLAGTGPDAEARAVLRRALPGGEASAADACTACLAMARAESDSLARLLTQQQHYPDPALVLCGTHLSDVVCAASGPGQLTALLAWQAACVAALPSGRLRFRQAPGCPVCHAASLAADDSVAEVARAAVRSEHRTPLCVRHYLVLREADKRAGMALTPGLAGAADLLASELAEAFEQTTWTGGRNAAIPQSAAWQRAAAFLDGSVSGGWPPPR